MADENNKTAWGRLDRIGRDEELAVPVANAYPTLSGGIANHTTTSELIHGDPGDRPADYFATFRLIESAIGRPPTSDVTVYIPGVKDDHGLVVPATEKGREILALCEAGGTKVVVDEYVPEGEHGFHVLPSPTSVCDYSQIEKCPVPDNSFEFLPWSSRSRYGRR